MKEWERREAELLRKENAWYDSLSPFMKAVDNPLMYAAMLLVSWIGASGLGLLIGMML